MVWHSPRAALFHFGHEWIFGASTILPEPPPLVSQLHEELEPCVLLSYGHGEGGEYESVLDFSGTEMRKDLRRIRRGGVYRRVKLSAWAVYLSSSCLELPRCKL